jgi:hypothetical protein
VAGPHSRPTMMSGYGTTNGALDATKGGAGALTHHVSSTNAEIVWSMTGCPPLSFEKGGETG